MDWRTGREAYFHFIPKQWNWWFYHSQKFLRSDHTKFLSSLFCSFLRLKSFFFSINFYLCFLNSSLAYLILGFPMLIFGRKTRLHHDCKRSRKEFALLYSLSPFSMANSLQLILEISATNRLVSYLLADNWLICRLRAQCMISNNNINSDSLRRCVCRYFLRNNV